MKIAREGRLREIRLETDAAVLDGERIETHLTENGASGAVLEVGGKRHRVRAVRRGDRAFVWCDGAVYEFVRAGGRSSRSGSDHADLVAPMPGRIRQTLVSEGDAVHKGQVLLVLEAMKMEHAIRSPRDGKVARLPHRPGDLVEAGAALVELV